MASGDEIVDDDKICNETIEIFECFIQTQFEIDIERNLIAPGTPGLPPEDLPHTPENTDNVSWQIGKKLASIADTLVKDTESKALIGEVVQLVCVGPDDNRAFDEFSEIAKKVMQNDITWQKVATLFYFGYCIARDRLTRGIQHFLSQLLNWIVNIFKKFEIFQWIGNQGGWRNFLGYDHNEGSTTNAWIYGTAVAGVVAIICVLVYKKYAR